nr:MAG TPA: hypothetical protein [Caudoviricetes sp.]
MTGGKSRWLLPGNCRTRSRHPVFLTAWELPSLTPRRGRSRSPMTASR